MKYLSVENPRWGNPENTIVLLDVIFEDIGLVCFSATEDDVEQHGVELFNKALNSDFGPIEDYQPLNLSDEILANKIRYSRDELLKETDWTQLSDVPELTREKFVLYRQSLRDITLQNDFPSSIVWPVKPI